MNLMATFDRFAEQWAPKAVASMNDYLVKVARVRGEFVWHRHDATDELFLVVEGEMTIEIEDRAPVTLGPMDLFVVPRGVLHRPFAAGEAKILLIEPSEVVNTGDAEPNERTAPVEWLH